MTKATAAQGIARALPIVPLNQGWLQLSFQPAKRPSNAAVFLALAGSLNDPALCRCHEGRVRFIPVTSD